MTNRCRRLVCISSVAVGRAGTRRLLHGPSGIGHDDMVGRP